MSLDTVSYEDLIERVADREAAAVQQIEWIGRYEGDVVGHLVRPTVEGTTEHGITVFGYGSCTYCDWLEGLYDECRGYSDTPDQAKYDREIEEAVNSQPVRWFPSLMDLVHYYTKKKPGKDWFEYDHEFREFIKNLA